MKTSLHKLNTMKRIIPVLALAASMAACNTTPDVKATQTTVQPADTTGLAQFQAWKAQNELVNTSENTAHEPETKTIVKYYPVSSARTHSSSSGTRTSTSSGTASKKKGWSSAAKGAVIGGVAGAAGGAIINKKNRAVGGVVGGVLGAGVGYGIGRSIDKKNGRN
jgi:predicted small secreted protein